MNALFERLDNLDSYILNEDECYTVWCHTSVRGFTSDLKIDGKLAVFTNKEAASEVAKYNNERGGHVNNFTSYGVSEDDIDLDREDIVVFDTYDEYKTYLDKSVADSEAKAEDEHSKVSKVRDDLAAKVMDAMKADSGINVLGDQVFIEGKGMFDYPHKNAEDVLVRTSTYNGIIIDVGVSSNGYSYGQVEADITKDLEVKIDWGTYSTAEAVDRILKDVHNMINKCKENRG